MIPSPRLITLVVGILVWWYGQTESAAPQVTLPNTSTTLTGTYISYNESDYLDVDIVIEAFLGIPFAEPPLDDLRFENPVKKDNLGQDYNATEDRSACPQSENEDEDCLYLSVHTTSPRPSNAPVMVWIHGGAYTTGAGSWSSYDPHQLIAISGSDIVVVHVNYRLGILGYLTTGDSASPGNYGMFDQIMALEWVQQNIEAFGGDPTRVTIMGESAGASSVGLHLVSPLSKGLFSQAIMQSGNALCPWAADTNIERQIGFTKEIADLVNCTAVNNEALIECLKVVEVQDLLTAQSILTDKYLATELLFVPVVDNAFLPDIPIEIIMRNEFHSVPTLLGTNEDEGTLIVLQAYPDYIIQKDPPVITLGEFRDFLPDYLYYNSPEVVSAVEQWYVDWSLVDNPSADQFEGFVKLNTDQVFACATEAMARAMEGSGAPVYRYEMTYDPSIWGSAPSWMGAGHGAELPYVFGWGLTWGGQTHEEKLMSVQFMQYWTNFIRTGDPNGPVSTDEYPPWPRYTLPEQEYKILSLSMENGRAMRADACAFWLHYVPTLYEDPDDVYQDWQREYEEWRDVHMTEWNEVFDTYKENGGCDAAP